MAEMAVPVLGLLEAWNLERGRSAIAVVGLTSGPGVLIIYSVTVLTSLG